MASDKERNDYPNLILLCTKHHTLIDALDHNGEPLHSESEIKGWKVEHETWFRDQQQAMSIAQQPTLLAEIVKSLLEIPDGSVRREKPAAFKIEEKIQHNEISRYRGIIEKYSVFFPTIEGLYDELEAHQKSSLLNSINDVYIMNIRRDRSADDILDSVLTELIEKVTGTSKLGYTEQLEWSMRMIMVDAFMRCKILEESSE